MLNTDGGGSLEGLLQSFQDILGTFIGCMVYSRGKVTPLPNCSRSDLPLRLSSHDLLEKPMAGSVGYQNHGVRCFNDVRSFEDVDLSLIHPWKNSSGPEFLILRTI